VKGIIGRIARRGRVNAFRASGRSLAVAEAERATWETIGASYARARRRPWKEVTDWVAESVPKGGRVLDLGCGNGRHAVALRNDYDVVAVDFASPLVAAALARVGGRVALADARNLPMRARTFDAAVFIASLHNIRHRAARISALAEVRRVLRPNAPALVTVWNRWQAGRAGDWLSEAVFRALGDRSVENGDAWVPWPNDGNAVPRFYHFYGRLELRADLRAAGFQVEALWGVRIAARGRVADNLFASVRVL
jgi:ubiquinone/menaquinone biosynthesis C-methylase UbiE